MVEIEICQLGRRPPWPTSGSTLRQRTCPQRDGLHPGWIDNLERDYSKHKALWRNLDRTSKQLDTQDGGQVHDGMAGIDILQSKETLQNLQTVHFDMQHTCDELDAQVDGHVLEGVTQDGGEQSDPLGGPWEADILL